MVKTCKNPVFFSGCFEIFGANIFPAFSTNSQPLDDGAEDIVVAAMMGAEEFGFGSVAMIAEGCHLMRVADGDGG